MTRKRLYILLGAVLLTAGLLAVWQFSSAGEGVNSGPKVWAAKVDLPGSDNFHKVSKDLYRAAQPTQKAMRAYEEFGIKTVINLRAYHSDRDEVHGTGLTLIEIPVKTTKADDDETVIRVLQTIRDAEKPVLIHCQHGADRTGLMVAMYRIVEQGWTNEEALNELKNGGFGFHSIWMHIPDYVETVDVNKIKSALK